MAARTLGQTGLAVSPIGFGAFKIGRNEKTKYPGQYDLPTDEEAGRLLNDVVDLGIQWIDTAPAYGLSEERIGRFLSPRRNEIVLSTKVGEQFENGESRYDFTAEGMAASVHRSLARLRTDAVDLLFLHVPGNDLAILSETDAVPSLIREKQRGSTRFIGISAKSAEAARASFAWADVLMLEYHLDDRTFEPVIAEAQAAGIGVVVKKGLASGRLPAAEAIDFVLACPGVGSLTVGSLNREHLRQNLAAAHRRLQRAAS